MSTTVNLEQVISNSSTGLSAQSIRMNTIASNLANAGSVGSTEEGTYHTKYPIFHQITQQMGGDIDQPNAGVEVTKIDQSTKPLEKRYDPSHPMANEEGYVFVTDVNPISEMTNMIAASKEYQANVEVINTIKTMINQSLVLLNNK